MNTLIYGFHWKSQSKAIEELQKEGIINISFWIGAHKKADIHIGKLRRFQFEKSSYTGLNREIYDKVFDEGIETFMDMFSRVPSAYTLTYQEYKNIFNFYFDYFSKILHDKKIELLIYYMLPHFGSDYILYLIAKHMELKQILIYQSLVPNRFFYVHDLEDFGKFEKINLTFEHDYIKVPQKLEKKLFYMKYIKPKHKSCIVNYFKNLGRWIYRKHGYMTFFGFHKLFFECLEFKRNYNKYAKKEIDFSKNFVYFPLQWQPELTTSTLGGIYKDQLLAIERIRDIIPDDWKIYVKENPKQLGQYRGKYFFKRLLKIPGVEYVSKEVNTYELLKNCRFSATVTGTVGWESITGSKPVLVFGKAWYESLPGVIKYSNDINLDTILNTKIDHEILEKKFNDLISKTANGIIDRGYIANFKEYSDDNNAKYVKNSLQKIITNLKDK
ncbi:capsular polysaccharide export protein, LipB/KpsS family [Caminibacter pacificus]